MKRILSTIALSIVAFFGLTLLVAAPAWASALATTADVTSGVCTSQDPSVQTEAQKSPVCKDAASENSSPTDPLFGPSGILTLVLQIFAIVVGIIAVIMIIVSGLRFIVSNGDPNTVTSARNGIIFAVVGLIIVALAQTVISFVLDKL